MRIDPRAGLEALRAVKKRAAEVLGEPNATLWLTQGKAYVTPNWSGRYLNDLVGSGEGCAVLMRFLEALEVGDTVPVVLVDRFHVGEFTSLRLIGGRLHEVWPGGKRGPVSGKAIGVG